MPLAALAGLGRKKRRCPSPPRRLAARCSPYRTCSPGRHWPAGGLGTDRGGRKPRRCLVLRRNRGGGTRCAWRADRLLRLERPHAERRGPSQPALCSAQQLCPSEHLLQRAQPLLVCHGSALARPGGVAGNADTCAKLATQAAVPDFVGFRYSHPHGGRYLAGDRVEPGGSGGVADSRLALLPLRRPHLVATADGVGGAVDHSIPRLQAGGDVEIGAQVAGDPHRLHRHPALAIHHGDRGATGAED